MALAAKLRVLHSELANENGEQRVAELRELVNHAVAAIQPHERERFLQDLLIEFPTWSTEGGGAAPAPAAVVTDRVVVEEVRDPAELVKRLIEASKSMSEADRAKVAERLAAAGLVRRDIAAPVPAPPSGGIGLPDGTVAALRRVLGAPAEANFAPERMAELLTIATDYLLRVEMMSTTFAREIGVDAKYSVFTQQVLKKSTERFLSGDAKYTKEALKKAEESNRVLIAAVLRAVRRAGEQFAADHMMRFAPEEIEKAVGAGTFGRAGRLWDAYCAMMKTIDRASIAKRIQELVKKEIEEWLGQFMGQ
ncbi:MAG: hypothetical protein ACOYN0_01625 [Phycisphaerales bacterium]